MDFKSISLYNLGTSKLLLCLFIEQVERLAALHDIHLRTGCFCNTGACQQYIGLTNQGIKDNLEVSKENTTCISAVEKQIGCSA